MKNLKLVILACGIAGLAGLILPLNGGSMIKLFLEFDKVQAILLLAAFALPTIAGAMAMAKPPMAKWQPIVAIAGFGLGAVKFRIWEALPHITDDLIRGILILGGIVLGLVASIMAVMKPEQA
jgi:hypothetical protein